MAFVQTGFFMPWSGPLPRDSFQLDLAGGCCPGGLSVVKSPRQKPKSIENMGQHNQRNSGEALEDSPAGREDHRLRQHGKGIERERHKTGLPEGSQRQRAAAAPANTGKRAAGTKLSAEPGVGCRRNCSARPRP